MSNVGDEEAEDVGLLDSQPHSKYGTTIQVKQEEESTPEKKSSESSEQRSPVPVSSPQIAEATKIEKEISQKSDWSRRESEFAERWTHRKVGSNRAKGGCCKENFMVRFWQQLKHRSTCDPYVKVTLLPQAHTFETKPVFGGGSFVKWGDYDDNYDVFQLRQSRLDRDQMYLGIRVYDKETFHDSRLIGSTYDRSGKTNIMGVKLDVQADVDMYRHIPIWSAADDADAEVVSGFGGMPIEASSLKYSGHIQVKIHWNSRRGELHVWVLGGTNLNTGEVKPPEEDPKFVFFAFCIFFLYLLIGAVVFSKIEGWSLWIAFWFMLVTTTTVGYGDYFPTTDTGKMLNCLSILVGLVALAWCFQITTTYLLSTTSKIIKNAKERVRKIQWTSSKRMIRDTGFMSSRDSMHHEIHDPEAALQQTLREEYHNFLKTLAVEFLFVGLMIIAGTLFFGLKKNEEKSWVDAFQWCFVTMSTVGYGDVVPITTTGRVFGTIFMIFGIALLARFGSAIMDYQVQKRQIKNEFKVLTKSLVEVEQIADFDKDLNGSVDRYEYIRKMLILTGYVDEEILDRFDRQFDEISTSDKDVTVADISRFIQKRAEKQVEAQKEAEIKSDKGSATPQTSIN